MVQYRQRRTAGLRQPRIRRLRRCAARLGQHLLCPPRPQPGSPSFGRPGSP